MKENEALPSPIAWTGLFFVAAIRVALSIYGTTVDGYGFMTDELYYMDSVDRLEWGFVDHPPFSVALLGLYQKVFGPSFIALRLFAGGIAGIAMILTGLVAREFGGDRHAQWLAAAFALTMPVMLGISSFYSMNVIDFALTAGATLVLAKIARREDPARWITLGLLLGIGLLNKYSTLWFGFGLAVGMLATNRRAWIATRGPWVAAALAVAMVLPHLFWQWQTDFPTLEFLRNAAQHKVEEQSFATFASSQLLAMNPVLAPLWIGGLAWLFVSENASRFRFLAFSFIAVFLFLAATGSARIYYLAPSYVIPMAAAAVGLTQLARRHRWVGAIAAVACVVSTASMIPFSVPFIPADDVRTLFESSGQAMPADTDSGHATLPGHLSLQHHAAPTLEAFSRALASLSSDEQSRAGILTDTFGSVAAVNLLGRDLLPRAIGVHNQYWRWGPADEDGDVMIVLWSKNRVGLLQEGWREVEEIDRIECDNCAAFETRDRAIYRCVGLKRPLTELWPKLKLFR